MNTAVKSLPSPAPRAFASAGARLRTWVTRAASAFWRGLEATGRARAYPHLTAFADQCAAQQPGLAKELRAASRQGPMG